ncbi:MAG: N-acetylmuramic acid 6-phosphate etherase [Alsobacter sp.]
MTSTETISSRYAEIDCWDDGSVLEALVGGQERAVAAVRRAIPALASASEAIAARLRAGGRLVYAGAGSSAGIAVQDGAELPGTFGIPRERIVFLVAGGLAALADIDGAAEDDAAQGRRDVSALGSLGADVMIAVSASGRTRYTLAAAEAARQAGAVVVGIANNEGSPLLALSDRPVLLDSGPEVIAGSTRMGAGTAQKCALGLISTLVATRLGHVHAGMMVGVRAENAKLRERARGIVATIAGVDGEAAGHALETAGGDVKAAVLICAGARTARDAQDLLAGAQGSLRQALARLKAA